MPLLFHSLESRLASLDKDLGELRENVTGPVAIAVDRWRIDAAALRFHLQDSGKHPPLVAILGGTGTGKSTLVNRLLEANLSATSFRRTYTAGAVAVTADPAQVPKDWLGVEHHLAVAEELPARGRPESLIVVTAAQPLAEKITLIDTPDLDGDQPRHHVQADRVFRWANAILFLVTPEKYQMTELLPYYRLAKRYAIPALFAMNKCEETAVLEDFARQLEGGMGVSPMSSPAENTGGTPVPPPEASRLFAIPRDDAAWNPPPGADLPSLRAAICAPNLVESPDRDTGLSNRSADLLGRLTDQVIAPLMDARREADRLILAVRQMESPEPGVDVNPLTQQLQRRLQQRSILYLMGPGRMLERARQVPGMIVRLPRTLWDAVIRGKKVAINEPATPAVDAHVPDFRANLVDQFAVVQSRMDDALRSNPVAAQWLNERAATYGSIRINPDDAGKIVDEELAELRNWLEKRWNATPRDTLLIMRLLRHLPGGQKLVQYFEATPYLLAVVVATHYALFWHNELLVVGGYSLATWLTEKLSNEVTNHVRATNRRIGERFAELAHAQIEQLCNWIDAQAPSARALERLENSAEELAKC